jgi:hypothetical protein
MQDLATRKEFPILRMQINLVKEQKLNENIKCGRKEAYVALLNMLYSENLDFSVSNTFYNELYRKQRVVVPT